ncbi:hypothetical protein ACQR1W_12795 [Bradyrhizobium sp. HKCCYLS1011]|uniref:hypothetical protein n=1 Tax=Bradyrhizobium sp. HKCCYLS1011 TaxID=3420733 RepID=UPI003EBA49E2
MFGPYEGNPEIANRLHAARVAAGFRSGRAAALAHGWSEPTLRAHETATGFIGPEMIEVYAAAFKVDPVWLEKGTGQGPPVDPVREARFRARIDNEGDSVKKAAAAAGRRLRLARRAAGYGSVMVAAESLDLPRSTLSAHELGQNVISPEVGRFYAKAFACSADWLISGTRPSGLPAAVEADLDALLDLHSRRESAVRDVFAKLREGTAQTPPAPNPEAYPRTRGSSPEPPQDSVPEITALELYRAAQSRKPPHTTSGRLFSFPAGFLSEQMNCGSDTAVILATGPDRSGRSARILVDRAFVTPNEADSYAVVREDGVVDIVTGLAANEPRPDRRHHWLVVGKVCAVLKRYLPSGDSEGRRDD